MKNLMAIISRNQYGCCSIKLVFDSREKMPTADDIKAILQEHMPGIKKYKLVEPALTLSGKYTQNYFDVLSYHGEHNYEEFETKTIYENRELIEDFKQNSGNIWQCEAMPKDRSLINENDFAQIYNFNRSMET